MTSPAAVLAGARRAARAPFVGRAEELDVLLRSFDDRTHQRCSTVFVLGPSGIGKSALVSRALEEMRGREPSTVVLRGRCHENETVPYNAFDGVVDDLSRTLRTLYGEEAERMVKACAFALLDVFPTLRSVSYLAEAADRPGEAPSGTPLELRHRAFEELGALLSELSTLRPVVVVLDDVHWADAESLALLENLTGLEPAPPILLLCTARPDEEGNPCGAVQSARGAVHLLALGGLSEGDARELVAQLVGGGGEEGSTAPGAAADVEAILKEAHGHPMFIDEMLHFAMSDPHHGAEGMLLDDALRARVARLDPTAQRALEVIAAAGIAVSERAISRVVKVAMPTLAPALAVLKRERLVRATGALHGSTVEPYHDRVREAVYGGLDEARRTQLHRRLGLILAKLGAPPEVAMTHFDRSGDVALAVPHALTAARSAGAALAFERAAQLYDYAIRSGVYGDDAVRPLVVAKAELLQRAGRPKDAAETYLAATRAGAPSSDERFELRRRAAEQFLMGGYLEDGGRAAGEVLARVGARLPSSRVWTLLLLGWCIVRVHLRRLEWTSRPEAEVPKRALARLDVFWSVGAGYALVDTVRGFLFILRTALEALDQGEDFRIARATATAAVNFASQGDGRQARRLLLASQRAAAAAGTELARFYALLAETACAFFVADDGAGCLAKARECKRVWASIGRRAGWEADVADQFVSWSLAVRGDHGEHVKVVDEGIASARASGNRFKEVMFRTSFGIRHLLRDDPDECRRDVTEAFESWLPGHEEFILIDYWYLKSMIQLALYEGRVDEATADLTELWKRFEGSILRRVRVLRHESFGLRGQCAMARASRAKAEGRTADMAAHLAEGQAMAKELARPTNAFARIDFVRMNASIACVSLPAEEAILIVRRSLAFIEKMGHANITASVAWGLGLLLGGGAGAEMCARSRAWCEREGVRRPEAYLQISFSGPPHPRWQT